MSNKVKAFISGVLAGSFITLSVPFVTFLLILVSSNVLLLHLGIFILMGALVVGILAGVVAGRSVARRVRRRPQPSRTFPTSWLSGEARA